ncbi:sensor histidine kinase [Streptomyces endophyticus]|uniref:histidine kinase n=1 Tax=Streptomyces endophyticus TaxID=714166 RepID=A0ABU6F456_9ACTN|nr:nitrate- and nitrite sensing domain-containing protein [Streptomyces endophyticus]MEB8337696.1 nitrate- and nitrite sensing domain-containing protein [Streptomyces endophyticus]
MQGRKNRDGSAAAEPEPRGGTGPTAGGTRPPHAQNPGRTASVDTSEADGRSGASGSGTPSSAKPRGPMGPGSRLALRNWRISTRLVSLLALPVVAATSLGALRIAESLNDIQQLDNMKLLTEMTKQATELASALQEERDQAAGPLSNGSSTRDFNVKSTREKTDRAQDTFLQSTTDIKADGETGSLNGVREHAVQIAHELINLNKIRQGAYDDKSNSSQTVDSYARIIDELLSLSTDMAQATSSPEMIQRTRALSAFSSAKEYASEQRAIIAAGLPPNSARFGKLSETDRQYGLAAAENQESQLQSFKAVYGAVPAQELLKPIEENNSTIKAADTYANRVLQKSDGIRSQDKRSYKDWVDADTTRIQEMSKIELTLLNQMEQQARELRNASERSAIINGALILLVLGVSLVGAFVVARSMIRSLRRLQDTATKVAQDRLPELVRELSESDPQDIDTSVESVGVHSRDEIGKVAAAFDDVHREAVRLAAEQALLRGNVNAMFTNLSRRSQGLIQRQLSLISELESREADPDQLSSLFKLDHLATRMRRNGENLLVLAGEEPGRRWTRPVPLVDVLRAAASEVEQYERIELAAVPATEVAGRVVNDLVHLLAELLENATSFSSPQTKVKVTGHALPDGRVLIEIHDTGIGLSPEDLAAINERLASPPTVDVSVSRRMGLFVVGRLSQRHGIRIQLRPSDSGGTTALVMLPVDVAQGGKKPSGKGGPGSGGPAAAQAAAGVAAARRGQAPGNSGAPAGLLGGGSGAPGGRPQVGAGTGGPRAALPARGGGPQAPAGSGANGPSGPSGPSAPSGPSGPSAPDVFSKGQAPGGPVPPQQRTHSDPNEPRGRRPVLPPRGGPRAELPGGNPQPRTPSWGDENAQPNLDVPRGHDEPDSTARFPRVHDDRQGPPQQGGPGPSQDSGQFVRSDVFGPRGGNTGGPDTANGFQDGGLTDRQDPSGSGQFNQPQGNQPSSGRHQRPQEPSSTAQFPRVQDPSNTGQYGRQQGPSDSGGFPRPQDTSSGTGQYNRPPSDPANTGQYSQQQGDPSATGRFQNPQEPSSTAQFPRVQDPANTGQYNRPPSDPANTGQYVQPEGRSATGQFEFTPPKPPQRNGAQNQGIPAQPSQEDFLPPGDGSGGDGRTPLYDTLETNWFHGQNSQNQGQAQNQNQGQNQGQNGRNQNGQGRNQGMQPPSRRPEQGLPQRPQAQAPSAAPSRPAASPDPAEANWRQSPNDDLMRQAERVRKPAAGGVTHSGLPRRVPRANLVAGTAQEQQTQTGPQVSRAPDEVRGRLTNLRRGIQQGRQAGNTGSYPSPTHQQER